MSKFATIAAVFTLSFGVAQAASTTDPVTGVKTTFPVANAFAYGQVNQPVNVPNGNAYGQDKASKPVLGLPDNSVGLGNGLDQANTSRIPGYTPAP